MELFYSDLGIDFLGKGERERKTYRIIKLYYIRTSRDFFGVKFSP